MFFIRKRTPVAAISTNFKWGIPKVGFEIVTTRRGVVFGRKVGELAS